MRIKSKVAAAVLCILAVLPESARAQNVPPTTFVDRDACPFECCLYREWTATKDVNAYVAERDTSKVAFRLAANERFIAETGNVHLDEVGLAVVTRRFRVNPPIKDFEPGDTLYVLSHMGELTYRMWYKGEIIAEAGFWEIESDAGPYGTLVREPEPHWWVKVRKRDGQVAWLDMDHVGRVIRGKDACG